MHKKVEPIGRLIIQGVISVLSIPYYRFYTRNTLWPALDLARYANAGFEHRTTDRQRLHSLLCGWQERKRNELSFISIMCIAMTAIVSASFSWNNIQSSFWLGPACWYATLMWSVFSILVTSQQLATLSSVGDLPKDYSSVSTATLRRHLFQLLVEVPSQGSGPARADQERHRSQWQVSWKSIFIWQLPLMGFGYGFVLYIVGLTVVICTPLLHDRSGDDFKTAMFYIISCIIGAGLFIYSATLGYSTIELAEDKSRFEEEHLHAGEASDQPGGKKKLVAKEYDTLIRSLTGASQISK